MVNPCCCGGACTTTITGSYTGCNSIGIPSMTVEAHDATAGGTLLASTTTNSSGVYTFANVPGVSGNDIVIVPVAGARFAATNRTLTWVSASPNNTQWGCGTTTSGSTILLAPASGYHCFGGYTTPGTLCYQPWKDTLNFSHSILGTCTLSWSATNTWTGTLTFAWGGCTSPPCLVTCAGGSLTLTITLNVISNVATLTVRTPVNTGTLCPQTGGGGTHDETYNSAVITCSPIQFSSGITAGTRFCPVYNSNTVLPTVTITE